MFLGWFHNAKLVFSVIFLQTKPPLRGYFQKFRITHVYKQLLIDSF